MDGARAFWEHFNHGSDIGVRGVGRTREEAFEQVAVALCAVTSSPETVRPQEEVDVHCEAADAELLLFDWLNALIFEASTRHMLFSRFAVRFEDGGLCGRAWGEPVDVSRHQPAVEVKGATLTRLSLREAENGLWVAECVVEV